MALPLDKAYLTAIWLETLFYGVCVQRVGWNVLVSLVSRHQLYTLLDLRLRSHQEEKQDSMDHGGRGRLPVDPLHRPRIPWLHSTQALPPPTTPRYLTSQHSD